MICLYQSTTAWFRHFARVLFSRNFAYAKFRENRTLAKISEFTVVASILSITLSSCNSRQWNVVPSQSGSYHLYTFEQLRVNWGLIWGSLSINMSLTSWYFRATSSLAITITSVTSLHWLFWDNTCCFTWPVCNKVPVTFLEAHVSEEQVMSQCIFQEPLTLNYVIPIAAMYLFITWACTASVVITFTINDKGCWCWEFCSHGM